MATDNGVAIVGAGFGGMAAAYDLSRAGSEVTIFEVNEQVGGLSSGFKEPHWDWSLEKYYHHFFETDKHVIRFLDELGWGDKLQFHRPYTVMYHKGRFHPFDSIPAAISFPGLGWGIDKVRFGLVALYLIMTNNWRSLEKVTVDRWMRRWAGENVYRLMWEPLMDGKFGARYAKQVNMAWMWARLKARSTRLGSYRGGYQAFGDQLAKLLREMGVHIHLSTAVHKISPASHGGYDLDTSQGPQHFNQCLVTTSPTLLANLVPNLPEDYLSNLLNLVSMGAVVMVLALKQRLSEEGYYWFNLPKAAGFPFLALVEHTNFLSPDYYGGDHIVYIGDYLETNHEYFHLSEEQLLERFLPVLPRFNQNFQPEWIRKTWLFRTKYAQPVPLLNHSQNIPSISTPLNGLFFASMSQVYPWDRGTNYAIEIGRKAASIMMGESPYYL